MGETCSTETRMDSQNGLLIEKKVIARNSAGKRPLERSQLRSDDWVKRYAKLVERNSQCREIAENKY